MLKQIPEFKTYTDEELVAACIDQNRQAQHELYLRFVGMMKGICLRYAESEMEAEDILQEAFIQAFKNLHTYSNKGALGGWLRKITVHKALEQYRKNKSIQRIKDEVISISPLDSADDSIFDHLALDDLLAKIQSLPVGYRTIFNLYAIEGYTHVEIAELLGVSEGTSKSQFSRARQQLIALIEEEKVNENKRIAYAKR